MAIAPAGGPGCGGAAACPIETCFAQVAPVLPSPRCVVRAPGHERAVVLISGLNLHLLFESEVRRARLRGWQQPDSHMVSLLAPKADVFSFSYAQSIPVTEIARLPPLHQAIDQLREAGYAEIILVGHSAGGIIARQFVEENPDAGVTKVVQVSTPNDGSWWAEFAPIVKPLQQPFVDSLRVCARANWKEREGFHPLPDRVQFVCIVGVEFGDSDGVVKVGSQWPADLQEQGVPAVTVWANHESAVSGKFGQRVIARMVLADQPRWCPEHVEAMRRCLGIAPPH
jgi:pimeloyl-ACP methyl ester carboxylesterase